jgi:MSHA biogenesis protein MshP
MTPRLVPPRPSAHGFAIASAIFILVVLAALGAFIVNVSTNQQIGSALDIQGVRAYQAARAGIEWGTYQVQATPAYNFSYGTPPVAVGSAPPNNRACPASPSSFVPAAPTLAGFTVTVTCAAAADPVNGGPTTYRLVSTACNQPAAGACPNVAPAATLDYIERRIEATL